MCQEPCGRLLCARLKQRSLFSISSSSPAKNNDVIGVAMERGQTSRNMPVRKIGRLFWEVPCELVRLSFIMKSSQCVHGLFYEALLWEGHLAGLFFTISIYHFTL